QTSQTNATAFVCFGQNRLFSVGAFGNIEPPGIGSVAVRFWLRVILKNILNQDQMQIHNPRLCSGRGASPLKMD
ncbi:MAG: hypothetical protein ABUK01_16570, partial [Leptospirales bacterium]